MLLRRNSDVSFPILGNLNRAKISWVMSDWGGGAAPAAPSKYAPDFAVFCILQRFIHGTHHLPRRTVWSLRYTVGYCLISTSE